jgi:GH25 family lysozyme M1 (1,4-beta-N-acetylmuramidase)
MAFDPETTCDLTIDVSHFQEEIDWAAVKNASKKVAMIKATQGTETDDFWQANQAGAKAAGLIIIPYTFITHDDAATQIQNFAATTGLAAGMPAALDWEGNGAPHADVVAAVGLGIKNIINRDPLGYWGLNPPGNPTAAMTTWPGWIPRYGVNNGQPDFNHPVTVPWLFWQYTSVAQVDGIDGNVDASLFSGSEAELLAWCATGAMPASFAGV